MNDRSKLACALLTALLLPAAAQAARACAVVTGHQGWTPGRLAGTAEAP